MTPHQIILDVENQPKKGCFAIQMFNCVRNFPKDTWWFPALVRCNRVTWVQTDTATVFCRNNSLVNVWNLVFKSSFHPLILIF